MKPLDPNQRLWLIGGTGESADLAKLLVRSSIPCVVSITTQSARSLYAAPDGSLQVWVGRLSETSIQEFIQTHQVSAILDASHPFATEISQLAIATAARLHLPYLRYERPALNEISTETATPSPVTCFSSVEAFLASHKLMGQRALLTIGYRFLPLFKPWQERATLFARILPSVVALKAALEAGFSSDRIIALRPPIAADVERALWHQWQLSMVVTKASGTPGGEDVKRQLAKELGIKLVLISRPDIAYPDLTSDRSVALRFCQQVCGDI